MSLSILLLIPTYLENKKTMSNYGQNLGRLVGNGRGRDTDHHCGTSG
jgi:hypothetical protein